MVNGRETISLTIPGEPIAKPRAKGWFNQKTKILHHYYSDKSGIKGYEEYIRETCFKLFKRPVDGPVEIEAEFIFPRPKAMIWKKKPMPRVDKITKPDYDNLLKSLTDAMNGVVFRDDGQVTRGSWKKSIAGGDEIPRTIVTITFERAE